MAVEQRAGAVVGEERAVELLGRERRRERLGARASELALRRTGGIVALDLPGGGGWLAGDPLALRARAFELGVLLRPLGNVVYALPPACTTEAQCASIADAIGDLASS